MKNVTKLLHANTLRMVHFQNVYLWITMPNFCITCRCPYQFTSKMDECPNFSTGTEEQTTLYFLTSVNFTAVELRLEESGLVDKTSMAKTTFMERVWLNFYVPILAYYKSRFLERM